MKAYLVGGPANGKVIELPDSEYRVTVPEPIEYRIGHWSYDPSAPYAPNFKTVVYRKSFELRSGGFVFEVDEPKPEPRPALTDAEFAKLLKHHLRVNPGILNDEIRRAVRSMNLKLA